MKKTLFVGILALMLLAVPFAAAKGAFSGWKDAVAYLEGRIDALGDIFETQSAHATDVAALQAQIDALTARVNALEAADDGPGVGSGPDSGPPGGSGGGAESGGDDNDNTGVGDTGDPEEVL